MSLRPTKKTDLGKAWLKGRGSNSKARKIQPEYHLIVTEGTNTEPNYFGALRDEINKRFKNKVDLEKINLRVEGIGDNTINLFYKAKALADESANGYKHVWLVYDTDDFPPERINETAELCRMNSTEDREFHALWSNQCIELWFLLHFAYYHSDIHRREYWPKLTAHLNRIGAGDYKKNREDLFEVLRPYMKTAIANAERLARNNEGKNPSASAPGTEVYQIFEKLKSYLED